jgi:hypothetical protein
MRSYVIVVVDLGAQYSAQMGLAENNDVVRHSRRTDPISLSANPFCQGERGAMVLSRMPIARTRRC